MTDPGERDATHAPADPCERIREQLDRGAPWDAIDAFRDAGPCDDARLLYWGALAYARSGAPHEAHALLERAHATAAPLRADILSLRGRLWKDELHRRPDDSQLASRARNEYLAAYELERDPYPGVNAATLSMLAGDRATAQRLAAEVDATLRERDIGNDAWMLVTAGEAALLLGRDDDARQHYAAAYALARGDAGRVATMRRQLRLLARVVPEARSLLSWLRAPDVVAFTGHMIDTLDRTVPRFPVSLEPAVAAAIAERVARWHSPRVFTSAACGADLLFVEAAQAAAADVTIVLPFDRDDFVRTSVAVGGDQWVARFDRALDRAARVVFATREPHLGDDVLFGHAAELIEGLARLHASQLETLPLLLAAVDAGAEALTGGTREALERWQRNGGAAEIVDLAALRQAAAMATSHVAGPSTHAFARSRSQRTLKALLFADVAGYSRVHDADALDFQRRFWDIAARHIATSSAKPLLANTWGDALFVVFDGPSEAAEFALRLRDGVQSVDWHAAGLQGESLLRMSLHAGPVLRDYDPILGRDNYFGSSVTHAARIEPVTPAGATYSSEAFAACLAATHADRYALEYVGTLPLAKRYGDERLYRLEWR
jgi:hypothetical protein